MILRILCRTAELRWRSCSTRSADTMIVRNPPIAATSAALQREVLVVEGEVWPSGTAASPIAAGPYTFPSPVEATRFVTHAVEAFIALACDVAAS